MWVVDTVEFAIENGQGDACLGWIFIAGPMVRDVCYIDEMKGIANLKILW